MEINKNIKNSNDAIRNTQFMSLSPTIVEKLDKVYEDALDFVIENENIKNAAISGHYGSGKSSIWQTYKNMRNINNVIYISLGDYCQGDEEGNSISRIEKQILTQILAQVNQKDIPLSKYKLKFNKNKCTIAKYVLASLIFILSIIGWFIKSEITSIYMIRMHVYLSFIILLFVTPLIYLIYRIFKGELFQISKINLKIAEANAQPSDEKDESIFDKDIKEIIYILKSSNVKYVLFEDLDRYDNVLIFSKLRELNYLLNADRSKEDSNIKFIYMVRDDLFDVQTRTKFFDFILPVIPIVDSENSEGKLMEYFKDNNNIPDKKVLRKISIYIDDMRILKNIVNEFNIYSEILLPQKLNLDNNKLFSIIVLKNIFPEEFSLLQRNRGYIYNIFKKVPYYKEDVSKEIKQEIIKNENNLRKLENEVAKDVFEAVALMLPGYLSTGERKKWSEYLKDWSDNPEREVFFDGISHNYEKFLHRYINNKSENKKRLDNIKNKRETELDKLRKKIIELNTYLDEMNAQSLKEFLNSIDESKLTNIFEDKEIVSSIVSNHYFPLIKFLLMEGLVNESYRLYLGIFRKGSISLNDKIFLSNILSSNINDYSIELNAPEIIFEELEAYHYRREAILNKSFIEWLIENDKKSAVISITENFIDERLMVVLSKLTEEKIKEYSEMLLETNKKLYKEIFQITNIKNYQELYDNLILSIIKAKFDTEDELREFSSIIEESSSVLNLIGNYKKEFENNINYGIIKFENICVENISDKILRVIIKNNAYKVTTNNIKFIIERRLMKKIKLDKLFTIIKKYNDIEKYVQENLLEFLHNYLKSSNFFNDDEDRILMILSSNLIYNMKILYLEKNKTKISDISIFKNLSEFEEIIKTLVLFNTMEFNKENINLYWETIMEIDEEFISYLELNLHNDNKDIIHRNYDLYYKLNLNEKVSKNISDLLKETDEEK